MQEGLKDCKKQNVIIIIPTYNEAENITFLVKNIFFHNPEFFILIVDDNSPDGTSYKVRDMQNQYPHLCLINRECRLGLGSAYVKGFKYALEKGYDVIIQMDADLSHSSFYITKMLDLFDEYDLVIASRYTQGGGVSNWSLLRIILSRTANIFSKVLLRIPIDDLSSGFKCIKRNVVEKINFSTIQSRGYAFQIEEVYRVFFKGFKIKEYPIVFKGRKNGKSKMSFWIIVETFFKVIFLCIKRNFR